MIITDWDAIKNYISEAYKRFKINLPQIPVEFFFWEMAKDNSKKCFVWFKDLKLKKNNQREDFKIIITSEFLDPQTTGVDLAAGIPSNATDEARLILRIAYTIKGGWEKHILECWRKIAPNQKMLTWAFAKAWYDGLQ